MSAKIYVGNLSFSTSNQELENLFSEHGDVVSVKIITDRDTGRSKGFGFVEMGSDKEAMSAIDALNNTEVNGRSIRTSEAQDKPPRTNNFESKRRY